MLADIWTVSLLILTGILVLRKGDLERSVFLRNLFPSIFGNNWYMNCYMIFYAIHPAINRVITGMNKKTMFRTIVSMMVLYLIIAFFSRITDHIYDFGTSFFCSSIVAWIIIYFFVGYQKIYAESISKNTRLNLFFVIFGIVGNCGLICLTNIIDLKTDLLNRSLLMWNEDYNPFLIALAIGLFNLAKNFNFVNKPVNYISKLSIYIYTIHENQILRSIYRPAMWHYVLLKHGYDNILIWIFYLTGMIFVISLVLSILYFEIIHKLVVGLCDKLYPIISTMWSKFENKIIKES